MKTQKLKLFAKRHWLPIAGFCISAVLAVWFGFTFLASAIYFNDPRHQDEALKGWMTPRYIVLSYELPREVVFDALAIEIENKGRPPRMENIAADQDVSLDELTKRVRAVADQYRKENPK